MDETVIRIPDKPLPVSNLALQSASPRTMPCGSQPANVCRARPHLPRIARVRVELRPGSQRESTTVMESFRMAHASLSHDEGRRSSRSVDRAATPTARCHPRQRSCDQLSSGSVLIRLGRPCRTGVAPVGYRFVSIPTHTQTQHSRSGRVSSCGSPRRLEPQRAPGVEDHDTGGTICREFERADLHRGKRAGLTTDLWARANK
jgi:hypothetical protein